MRRLVDLTLTIDDTVRGVEVRPVRLLTKDGWNATTLNLYSHSGTHMDAPLALPAGWRRDRPAGPVGLRRARPRHQSRADRAAHADHARPPWPCGGRGRRRRADLCCEPTGIDTSARPHIAMNCRVSPRSWQPGLSIVAWH